MRIWLMVCMSQKGYNLWYKKSGSIFESIDQTHTRFSLHGHVLPYSGLFPWGANFTIFMVHLGVPKFSTHKIFHTVSHCQHVLYSLSLASFPGAPSDFSSAWERGYTELCSNSLGLVRPNSVSELCFNELFYMQMWISEYENLQHNCILDIRAIIQLWFNYTL